MGKLHDACEDGNLKRVKKLIKRGYDINKKDEYGNTPLHVSLDHERLMCSFYLIKKGANINKKNKLKHLPLHFASRCDNIELIKKLVTKSNINKKDRYGQTPIIFAASNFRINIIEELIKYGAKVNTKDVDGNTPLHNACYSVEGDILISPSIIIDIIRKFVTYIVINEKNNEGDTPLLIAAKNHNLVAVKELIKCGADTYIKNNLNFSFSDYLKDVYDIDEILKECSPLDIKEPCIEE